MRVPRVFSSGLLAGCTTAMIARPPPRLAATDVVATPEGHARLSGLLATSGTVGETLEPASFAGPIQFRAGLGLAERLDLSLALGYDDGGPYTGAWLGVGLRRGRAADLGLLVGSGYALTAHDEPSGTWRHSSVSPGLGLRATFHLSDRLRVPVAARGARAIAIPGPRAPADADTWNWTPLEAMAGLSWQAAPWFIVDGGVGLLFSGPPDGSWEPLLMPTLALTLDLDPRSHAGRAGGGAG